MVDQLWREIVPEGGQVCILFAHSGNGGDIFEGNVERVDKISDRLECERLIIVGYDYDDTPNALDKLEVRDMLQTEFWNKCRHHKTDYNGNVKAGIQEVNVQTQEDLDRNAQRSEERTMSESEQDRNTYWVYWKKRNLIGDDWLIVTVDYHN